MPGAYILKFLDLFGIFHLPLDKLQSLDRVGKAIYWLDSTTLYIYFLAPVCSFVGRLAVLKTNSVNCLCTNKADVENVLRKCNKRSYRVQRWVPVVKVRSRCRSINMDMRHWAQVCLATCLQLRVARHEQLCGGTHVYTGLQMTFLSACQSVGGLVSGQSSRV